MAEPTIEQAIAQYAHSVAKLPSFPKWRPRQWNDPTEPPPVMRVITLDKVPGQVLPATEDVWLGLRPFDDILESTTAELKKTRIQRRRDFLALLVMLAAMPGPSRWDATMCLSRIGIGRWFSHPDGYSVWIDLVRELDASAEHDDKHCETERGLIAMSHSPRPRFLLCVPTDPSLVDFGEMLGYFLFKHTEANPPFDVLLERCNPSHRRGLTVEIGVSFTTGTISLQLATQLKPLLEQNEATRADRAIHFRVTTVCFGPDCVTHSDAAAILDQLPHSSITRIQLGRVNDPGTALVQPCLQSLVDRASHLQRLRLDDAGLLPVIASLVRCSDGHSLTELDIRYRSLRGWRLVSSTPTRRAK